ncbi:hypothetical protein HELRODRAFT_153607, partial [Helobdella robusta]|uniref:RING-type domain-containing protein n=1 Tax=Helobdella robusta TaxID=6412 RepID=T1EL94_HELRO
DHISKNHTCGICWYQFVENKLVFELSCKHAFHFSCLKKWMRKKTHCPHCEKPVV